MIYISFILGIILNACNPTIEKSHQIPVLQDSILLSYLPTQGYGDTILFHQNYIVSYSIKYKNPEWTIYRFKNDKQENNHPRRRTFLDDPQLKKAPSVYDFSSSGYDRGHMVPAEDMDFHPDAMNETFFITNVAAQDPDFNRGIWKKLEYFIRKIGSDKDTMIVITGSLTDEKSKKLENGIFVPSKFYKVLFIPGNTPKAIAFLMTNEKSNEDIFNFACSVKSLEESTGIEFFRQNINSEFKTDFDMSYWKQ